MSDQKRPWDEQIDIVVIGSGFAGLAAAIEAAEAGAGVVVMEKMKITGGNSRISDGGLAVAGSALQERDGIADPPELMARDMITAGLDINHRELVKTVTEESNAALVWTEDHLGVKYMDKLDQFGGHSVPRGLTTESNSGSAIIKKQLGRLKELGVEVRTRACLTSLIRERGGRFNGRVTGVEYLAGHDSDKPGSGEQKSITARKGVVLASGGYGADVAFRSIQDPRLTNELSHTNHQGATAEGLISALELGAAPVHLSWIQLGPWGCPDESGYGRGATFASYALFPMGLVVHPDTGQRFFNEQADRKKRADALLAVGKPSIGMVDAAGAARHSHFLEATLKKGQVKGFDSPARLAAHHGLPEDTFKETVEKFNQMLRQGRQDPFGRVFVPEMAPLTEPPFYSLRLFPKIHFCMGGMGINPLAQVIDLRGRVMEGLFAAGEVTGGVHGGSRLGSCAITECLVMGRIAGQSAAKG